MNVKYLLISALLGGLASFVWGAVYHAAIGIDEKTMTEFSDSKAVSQYLREHASGNGMYYAKEGVLAAIRHDARDGRQEPEHGTAAHQAVRDQRHHGRAARMAARCSLQFALRSARRGVLALAGLRGELQRAGVGMELVQPVDAVRARGHRRTR